MNIFNIMQQFQQNPMAMLQKRFNIPGDMKSPDAIVKHLLDSGQITQQQLNQVMGMRNMFKK